MTALLMAPMAISAASITGSSAQPNFGRDNTLKDNPAYEFRSDGGGFIVFPPLVGVDTVAVLGHNMRSVDQVRVRVYDAAGNVTDNWSVYGSDPAPGITRKSVLRFPTIPPTSYFRVQFIPEAGHPDTYSKCGRIIVGKGILTDGIDVDGEFSFL